MRKTSNRKYQNKITHDAGDGETIKSNLIVDREQGKRRTSPRLNPDRPSYNNPNPDKGEVNCPDRDCKAGFLHRKGCPMITCTNITAHGGKYFYFCAVCSATSDDGTSTCGCEIRTSDDNRTLTRVVHAESFLQQSAGRREQAKVPPKNRIHDPSVDHSRQEPRAAALAVQTDPPFSSLPFDFPRIQLVLPEDGQSSPTKWKLKPLPGSRVVLNPKHLET